MPSRFTELVVEEAALAWLEELGWGIAGGPSIVVGETAAERSDPNFRDVVLERRLLAALARLSTRAPAPCAASRNLRRASA